MIEAADFAVRALATGGVVIGITLLVQHLGTRLGGIVVGLPIVMGPGMYFLLVREGPQFVERAAVGALFALAASVAFAWSFARLAAQRSAWLSLGAAVSVWIITVSVLRLLPETLPVGLAAFGAAVLVTHLLGHDRATEHEVPAAARQPVDLLLRGVVAGLLVGTVGFIAPQAGPTLSGILIAFPIALTIIGVTLHQRHGGLKAARTLATAQFSMTSIAVFAAALTILLEHLSPQSAFWLAVAASLLPPVVLTLWRYPTQR